MRRTTTASRARAKNGPYVKRHTWPRHVRSEMHPKTYYSGRNCCMRFSVTDHVHSSMRFTSH